MRLTMTNTLLVEDNRQMAELVRAVLAGLGVTRFEHVTKGDAAMALLERRPFDVVFLDRRLGDEDGLDLARRIRRSPKASVAETPIIMLTGSSDERSVREARNAGVNAYLVKPFTVIGVHDRLVATLAQKPRFIRSESYIGPERRRGGEELFDGLDRRTRPSRVSSG